MTLGTATKTVDVSGHFRGGKKPITYKAEFVPPMAGDAPIEFKVEPAMNTTGVFTVSSIKGTAELMAPDFQVGDMFAITATDADKIPATGGAVTVTIKANRAPTTTPTGGQPIETLAALTVGSQNVTDKTRDGKNNSTGVALAAAQQPNPVCPTFDDCRFTIKLPTRASATVNGELVEAEYIAKLAEGSTPETRAAVVADDDVVGMTFEVVEHDSKYVVASAMKNMILVRGVKSTWGDTDPNTDGIQGGHVDTVVRVRAIDAEELWTEFDVNVNVDGPPTMATGYELNSMFTARAGQSEAVITGIATFFDDAEDTDNGTITVESSNHGVATPSMDGEVTDDGKLFTALREGTATITITVTDSRMQTLVKQFTLKVNPEKP